MLKGMLTKFQTDWILSGEFEEFNVGEYRVVDILGTGGMGWLYVAVNENTGEKAAVKVISKMMEKDYLTRFKLEARAGLKLNHPNIVRTLKLGETDEIWYMAMELVEGIAVQELIGRQGVIPWPQACSLVAQAAAGLQHAHERGLIHRDVKPGNLLVKKNGTVKVLDFGLALMEQNEDEFMLTMISGQGCVGTADYIAPEQSIDSFSVGPPADIYSLGCTLYCRAHRNGPLPRRIRRQEVAGPPYEVGPARPRDQAGSARRRRRDRQPDDGPQGFGAIRVRGPSARCPAASCPPRPSVVRLRASPGPAFGRSPAAG